ncbi:GlsB/YeaQ/YmgE family stress response membrane protein [Tropicimonas sp.]|uniref:GlsB/YeaQ/YmgE family stress response membrane protein n=1 Tax=Tropicimonas sp. TaxID=2067044 RepID=UPI003A85C0DB
MGLGLVLTILVGGLAGWIASIIMKSDTGIFMNVIIGIVGAVLLNWILQLVGIYPASAVVPQLIVGIAGACGLIWTVRRLRG